jgi:phenylacetate-CoA ligase
VGSLNRSEQYKGLPFLLEAVHALKQEGFCVHLTVAGDGDAKAAYAARAARLGLDNDVTFAGKVYGSQLVTLYQKAAVFVLPTLFDSAPLVVLEAMACGTPVVSTSAGGLPFMIDNGTTGLLAQPADAASLTDAIRRVLRNPALAQRLRANALALVRANYQWEEQARKTDHVLREVIAQTRSGHATSRAPYTL